jgi:hypothetical protein
MNEFSLWFFTGIQHICDLKAYDHICYIMVLCIPFTLKEWKKLLFAITAFTIGHSLTLFLSITEIIRLPSYLIELLIPLTIIFSSIANIINQKNNKPALTANYIAALLFGFIHGMGFSYLLKSMLGIHKSILFPLFSFNLGIEIGQFIIVLIILLLILVLSKIFNLKKADYVIFTSTAVFGIALMLFLERL